MTTDMRELLRRLAPLVGEQRTNRWWRAYLVSDYKQRQELEQCIALYAADLLQDTPSAQPAGNFPPPAARICAGEISLGRVKYGGRLTDNVGLRREELLRHVGIYGSSGAGKSNALALILDGLTRLAIPWWMVDFKRTFRSLIRTPGYEDLLVFTVGDVNTAPFAFNPLVPPPGTGTDVWAKKMVGIISHAFCQGAGSESLLITALQEAYAAGEKQGQWPTFKDVYEILESQPARGRKGMWMDSAKRAMQSLCTGNAAKVFCPEEPLELSRLLDKSIVFEIELLNVAESTLFSEALLMYVIQFRMQHNENRETLSHMICIEESHHLLRSPPGMGDGSEPIIHTALREVRELGEGIMLATQNASIVPLPVFGNQATTLAFHTKHQKDLSSTGQAMLLKEDARDALGRLAVGEAIVRLPRWSEPIQIVFNHRPIAKGAVSDTVLAQYMLASWSSAKRSQFQASPPKPSLIPEIPPADKETSTSLESTVPPDTASALSAAIPPPPTHGTQGDTGSSSGLSELERMMLQDVLTHPFSGVVERIKRLGVSRRKATAVLRALEERRLIRSEFIYTGKALIKLFDITPDGIQLCLVLKLGTPSPPSEGGVLHRFMVHHVASHLRNADWSVKTEYKVAEDLVVDVHAEADDRLRAVLVETGKSNIARNLKRTFEAGYEDILIIVPTPEVAASVRKLVAVQTSQTLPVMSLAEFLVTKGIAPEANALVSLGA